MAGEHDSDEYDLDLFAEPARTDESPTIRMCAKCGAEIPQDENAMRKGAVLVLNALYTRLLRAMTPQEAAREVHDLEEAAGVDLI